MRYRPLAYLSAMSVALPASGLLERIGLERVWRAEGARRDSQKDRGTIYGFAPTRRATPSKRGSVGRSLVGGTLARTAPELSARGGVGILLFEPEFSIPKHFSYPRPSVRLYSVLGINT